MTTRQHQSMITLCWSYVSSTSCVGWTLDGSNYQCMDLHWNSSILQFANYVPSILCTGFLYYCRITSHNLLLWVVWAKFIDMYSVLAVILSLYFMRVLCWPPNPNIPVSKSTNQYFILMKARSALHGIFRWPSSITTGHAPLKMK